MAECRYKGMCRIENDVRYLCNKTCMRYRPMPNRQTLLCVANELDNLAFRMSLGDVVVRPRDVYGYARSIYKALEGK